MRLNSDLKAHFVHINLLLSTILVNQRYIVKKISSINPFKKIKNSKQLKVNISKCIKLIFLQTVI